jgi:signal recognition particle subunit SRP54
MFQGLSDRFEDTFARLRRRGALSEADVEEAMREVRVALLEADVALPAVKQLVDKVRVRAVGQEVLRSVTPGQMVVKIVHDQLAEMLGAEAADLRLNAVPPIPILMVGLQGSGKTTTAAKLGVLLRARHGKKVLMASLDVRRPAAQEQLAILGRQASVDTLPVVPLQTPRMIADRALDTARKGGHDVVILDTAGRLAIDETMMQEAATVAQAAKPVETLLVADAMTGQDAVNTARAFHDRLKLTGIILTRIDGDARGGAALSMRAVTGCPIKFLGTGEKLDALEPFHPGRIASRILGMGDVVSLVEKAQATVEQDAAERLAARMQKGQFDLDDFASQLRQMRKMGGMSGILGLLPGVARVKSQLAAANIDDRLIGRQEAMILSMTPAERRRPEIIKASRKRRIAAGSGTTVPEINRLLKQFQEVQRMMKQVNKLGQKGFMRNIAPGMLPPGHPR